MKARLLSVLPLLLSASLASASSPAAWAAFDAKVVRECVAASGLRRAHAPRPIGFDDTLGKVVTLVTGTFIPKRGRPIAVNKLCVFDQRSGRLWLSEAGGWSAPAR